VTVGCDYIRNWMWQVKPINTRKSMKFYYEHVSATHWTIFMELCYTGWMYRDIKTVCEDRHRCKILIFKNT